MTWEDTPDRRGWEVADLVGIMESIWAMKWRSTNRKTKLEIPINTRVMQ